MWFVGYSGLLWTMRKSTLIKNHDTSLLTQMNAICEDL